MREKFNHMRVHFNLRDKNAQEKTSIFLVARHHGKNLRYSTGLSISPTLWDVKRNRPKELKKRSAIIEHSANIPEEYQIEFAKKQNELGFEITRKLNELEIKAGEVLMKAGPLSQPEFKKLMDIATGKTKDNLTTAYLLEFVRNYCQNVNNRGTLKSTATILVNLVLGTSYSRWSMIDWDRIKGRDIRFDAIDFEWRQRFYNHCVDQNLAASYIDAMLANVSHFLNVSRPKHHTNEVNKMKGWTTTKNAKTRHTPITLTLEEINRLAKLEGLSEQDTRIKDLFLIGVMSGQRFSDYSTIQPDQVRGGRVHFLQKKTKIKTAIPLEMWAGLVHETMGEILARYGNRSPEVRATKPDSLLNDRIKTLCQLAGINAKVEVISTNGDREKVAYCKKYEVISSHTARRTFATTWYRGKMSLASIAMLTGHKNVDQLKAYIGLSDEEHQQAAESEAQAARERLLSKAI